ncbi:MSCS-like 3 [Striga asiatica]|uniref:MSCS-like 3 n=1 Tax=Striga asiatica TaxID=4170 RepID=A0A5A7QN69_STRAF|nr:MSCS-like 3 [Striga asiatica]
MSADPPVPATPPTSTAAPTPEPEPPSLRRRFNLHHRAVQALHLAKPSDVVTIPQVLRQRLKPRALLEDVSPDSTCSPPTSAMCHLAAGRRESRFAAVQLTMSDVVLRLEVASAPPPVEDDARAAPPHRISMRRMANGDWI